MFGAASHFEQGIAFQEAGKLDDADRELRSAIVELRGSRDRVNLGKALSIESWVCVSLGKNADGFAMAVEAAQLHRVLNDQRHLADDLNTAALAKQNLGEYSAALEYFQQALRVDRGNNDAEGEITRLDNIGNVYFFEGRYFDALRSYEDAKAKSDATTNAPWNPRRRQVAIANLAAVYQVVGQEEVALELYRSLTGNPRAMPPREYAQLLLNQGALYRRLGDPVKALDLYKSAQEFFARDHYSDGEIGALRNTGIACALDLHDYTGALEAFDRALTLAENSANRRGIVQARLYRGEALRRLHKLDGAAVDAESALSGAAAAGMTEEQWRAQYLRGRIAEQTGDAYLARQNYTDSIRAIESMRSGLQDTSLRNEFLADKRDVYDALIALRLKDGAPAAEIFRWMEQSRARSFNDRFSLGSIQNLAVIQSHLPADSLLLEFWVTPDSAAAVWISPAGAGIVRYSADINAHAEKLNQALRSGDGWREPARELGNALLSGVPVAKHTIVIPDGSLATIPLEALFVPGSNRLLIENSDLLYLPSAQFLLQSAPARKPLLPWNTEMIAWADPAASEANPLADKWERLSASGDEVRAISKRLSGRSELHVGSDAQKRFLTASGAVPVLHFATHAAIDVERPERSRILLAGDYVFQGEISKLDLKGVDLVTLSACDTALGKLIRGEGLQAFHRAFLAAGARSTVSSLWRVPDEGTAAFMEQFYYFLARGQTKSQALRSAKLVLLRSRSTLENPRYWAAFVLTGDGFAPLPQVLSWSLVLFIGAAIAGLMALIVWATFRAVRTERRMANSSPEPNPR